MYGVAKLGQAFQNTLCILNAGGGFDTFSFRQGFEHDFSLSGADKEEILDYLKRKIPQWCPVYQGVKRQIDAQEFLSTDYYANPHPRKFVGAYGPTVFKTLGGVMAMSL